MATTKTKGNRPPLLPANVPGIMRELHHLAALSNAAVSSAKVSNGVMPNAAVSAQKPRTDGGRSLVVRGK
jgi:hypothetical protein